MHPDLAMLVVLQTHDLEAKRLRDQMASLTKQIAALETKAKATVGQRAVILDLIAKEEALRRQEEQETADLRAKLERNKKKLDMTTTTHPAQRARARGRLRPLRDHSPRRSRDRKHGARRSPRRPTRPRQRRRRRSRRHAGARPPPPHRTIARDQAELAEARSQTPRPPRPDRPEPTPAKPPSPTTTASPTPRAPPSPRPSTSSAPPAR